MASILRKLGGLVVLAASAPSAVLYARATYGPVALLFFCITVSICSCGVFLLFTPSRRSRY